MTNKDGSAAIFACTIVLLLIIIMSGISEYFRIILIARGVRDALQTAVTSVATQNSPKLYTGLREGYAGGYTVSTGGSWSANIDTGNVYNQFDSTLGLHASGASHVKSAGSKTEYTLYGLSITVTNAPFAPNSPSSANKFSANVTITLEVPVRFAGVDVTTMRIKLRTKAGYVQSS